MPKAITAEMLESMSPDQRKTLHKNALALATPAAQEVIALLTAGSFLKAPAAAAKASPKARSTTKKKTVAYGRQS